MGLPTSQRTWTLFNFLSWMFVGQVVADPQYFITVPATLEAGAETKFCVSLLQPNERLVIKITLKSTDEETTLLEMTSNEEFHQCFTFQAPEMQMSEVLDFKAVVYGDKFDSEEVRRVLIAAFPPMTFIQTDKPFYQPGQTVHFRVISLDSMFRSRRQLYSRIELKDLYGVLLGQWLNYTSNEKILQLSLPLSSEAREGPYTISVWIGGWKKIHQFSVDRYVLPEFDVTVKASDEISIGQHEIPVEVCAKYTFVQPVPASIEFTMCRPLHGDVQLEIPCYTETKQTEKNGCAKFNVEMATFTKLNPQTMQDNLKIIAQVEHLGTGISRQEEKNMKLSYAVGKLFFIDTPTFYNEGFHVEGKVKVVTFSNEPVPDTLVHLWIEKGQEFPFLQNLTTDSHGIATFTLNTTNYNTIQLRANLGGPAQNHWSKTPHFERAEHKLSLALQLTPGPKSFSSLKVKKKEKQLSCNKEENFSFSYTLVEETRTAVDMMYLVLSRGNIVMQGHQKADIHNRSVTEGEISFTLKLTPNFSPEFKLVAYAVLPNEIVIADSESFSMEKCFSNKVSLGFFPTSAVPGESVTLQVAADPGSLCGVSAVDQAIRIEEPERTLDTDKIFKLLPEKQFYYVDDKETCLMVEPRRSKHRHRRHSMESWSFPVFKEVRLKMVTNMFTRLPSCLNFKGKKTYWDSRSCGTEYSVHVLDAQPRDSKLTEYKIRSSFPEAWIWNIVDIGESGSTDLSLTVPDTITTWETEAFCFSPQGFGLAPYKTLTVFQPFFLELSLPYSIIRGEQFALKATVFNYLSNCIMVTVTPLPSLDYILTPLSGEQYTSCLCTHDQQTFSWTMSPSVLGVVNVSVSAEAVASQVSCDNPTFSVPNRGHIDVVTRSLIVKAEGTEQTNTYNRLLCPDGAVLSEEVELRLPENVITGSARATLSVLGDILGRALKNFDGLLKEPHGSGEQNIALMASHIYILEYLRNTQQLTPAIQKKATNFLTNGYQSQLNYRHRNGAYSEFRKGERNTWLTAFVLRSFVKASSFIFIDPTKITETKTWLESKQQMNGCFRLTGRLLNNAMKGGVADEVTLSAYITATFLEMNMSATDPVVQRSLSCLKESISYMRNNYTTALLAYVFTLAGDMETRALLFQRLDTVAIQQGETLHWSQKREQTSLSVEISSYVLLAKLSASPTAEDLGYSTRIVKWLTGQQDEYGGFSSKQDTVVALQALALYSSKVFRHEGSSTVTVQSPSGQLTFDVNPNNRMLYQEEVLKDVTGKYSLEVKGTTCAMVQISLHYNIPILPQDTTVYMETESSALCIEAPHRFDLKLKSLYRGNEIDTNMVIMEIKLLTGYYPDPASLNMIKENHLVDRVDHRDDLVVVHLKELPKNFLMCHIDLIKRLPVQNLKPGFVKIYDVYEPSCHVEMEYIDPCAAAKVD